jgi:predicted HTH transcriptional regulator
MANTRGGLIIFGVRDTTCELVGIDPGEVNIEQYAQWVRNHVQPNLSDLTFTVLTSADGATSVLVADVPASSMAPQLVYGTAARDKDQQAAVAPYRDHTAWMAEHQLERAYRDRFTALSAPRAKHATCSPTPRRPCPPSNGSLPPTSSPWPAPSARCRAPLRA